MTQPSKHQGESSKAEVGVGLAAAGREEKQVHHLAVLVGRLDDAFEVHEDEGELERPPCGSINQGWILAAHGAEATASGNGHYLVGDAEGVERLGVLKQG